MKNLIFTFIFCCFLPVFGAAQAISLYDINTVQDIYLTISKKTIKFASYPAINI